MAIPNNNISRFTQSLWLTLGMFVAFAIIFAIYVRSEKQIDRTNELRQQSFLLADELRHSSDDLTRMVRTYVVTGDPIYKQHYQEILDIRSGKKPRPVDYYDVYWDLVLKDDLRPRPGGQTAPLLELMQQAGFTEKEFAKLAQAKANSDALTRTEFTAMTLIESTDPTTEANRLKAIRMLNDASYHQAKYGIMQPISEFYRMMAQRTLEAVRASKNMATLVRVVLIFFGLLLIFTLWRAYRALHSSLGCSVIKADDGKLRQILINLLGNAIKFTEQGTVILRADTQPLPVARVVLRIEIIDSGSGIPEDKQKPFVQLMQENPDVNGTGLGLSISKFLVELMGGISASPVF